VIIEEAAVWAVLEIIHGFYAITTFRLCTLSDRGHEQMCEVNHHRAYRSNVSLTIFIYRRQQTANISAVDK
jgi:hypothetical protein